MSGGDAPDFSGISDDSRRRLMAVVAISIAMVVIELSAGQASGSQALQADALDFFGCGLTYALGFWAVGKTPRLRAGAALVRGASILVLGLWIAVTTLYRFFVHGVPEPEVMGAVGFLALAANLGALYLLTGQRSGNASIGAVWLAARNDTLGNVGVMIAAGLVAVLESGAPDLIVAGVMVALFLSSSAQILMQALRDWQAGGHEPAPDAARADTREQQAK